MSWKHADDDMWELDLGDGRVLEMLVVVGEPAWFLRTEAGLQEVGEAEAKRLAEGAGCHVGRRAMLHP